LPYKKKDGRPNPGRSLQLSEETSRAMDLGYVWLCSMSIYQWARHKEPDELNVLQQSGENTKFEILS